MVGEDGYESRSHNTCFAGRTLTGRVLMTVAGRPGRLPAAQLRDRSGRVSGRETVRRGVRLDRERAALVVVDVQEGFRKALPELRAGRRPTATLIRGAEAIGIPIVITEQYPKGLGETAPEVAEALPDGVEPLEKTSSPPPRPRASTSAAATRPSSAASRPTSASTRRCSTCSAAGVEVHVAEDAVGSRFAETQADRPRTRWSGPARC